MKVKNRLATDTTELQQIVRDNYRQLYANQLANLEEMDKFMDI
jgi:hypothetical protein